MSNQLRLPDTNLRPVLPGDEHAIRTFLEQHWPSTMLIRSNFRIGGLTQQGHPTQGIYVAMWDGPVIEGLAVHYATGTLMVSAPRSLGLVVREAVGLSQLPVTAIVGPWQQVETVATAFNIVDRARLGGTPQVLMAIALKDVGVPEAIIRENIRARLATEADLDTLLQWRMDRDAETHKLPNTPARRAAVVADMREQIRVQGLYVAETNRLVAMASYDMWSRDGVQIGGIWVPQSLRARGYGAVVVAEAATAAMSYGVARATLLVEKAHRESIASYRALGFAAIADHGVLAYPYG